MAFLTDAFRGPSSKLSSIDKPKRRRRASKGGSVGQPLRGVTKPGKVVSTGRSPENTDSMRKRFERERNKRLGRETRP